ncbi:peptidase s41 [Pontibacter diazotrophicus]|uniref:Peptidase s41 n=1 Tax=Pontibacter diazotrophicus TaxID=1400979 RepID=A0A3D8L2A7_9BACT|nr:S41 family peptidase [Pontibacter diazotrophicus]RDV11510.1 peptidase s41 [Pontibacter diazotrophicus]
MRLTSNIVILFFAICSSISSLQAQDCSCADAFETTVETYEKNYSLFRYKVTENNLAIYNAFTEVMREKAKQSEGLKECKIVLDQWLGFFRDGHNSIKLVIKDEQEFERIQVTEQQFKVNYTELGDHKDDVLGIWKWREYTVAIMPAPESDKRARDFVGVLLESTNKAWKPSDVIMELTKKQADEFDISFFMPDHSEIVLTGSKTSAGQLNIKGVGNWQKSWPGVEMSENSKLFHTFHIRMIDDIPYVRFPDFNVNPEDVKRAISANHEQLMNAEIIVVDLRDNGGGSDYAYFPILPYVLSGPIEMPHVGMWMSEDNLQPYLHEQVGKGKNPEDLTQKEKENYDWLMSYEDSLFYQKPGEYAYTYEADTLYKGPKKVAVLMNENSGSSAETFIFRAKQSDRVIFYGQNSAGVVDGFMVFSKNIGCFELSYPHAVRAKDVADNPIDPYGFEPDVYLDKNVDALEFSIKHMKQLIKNRATEVNK